MASAHADMQTGLQWLQGQVQASGQLSNEADSIALALQARSETARTLQATHTALPAPLLGAVQSASTDETVEFLARQALALQAAGSSANAKLAALLAMQNTDGGFGAAAGFSSNPLDTAWALLALHPEQASTAAAQNAVAWLLNHHHASGSWPVTDDEDALASTALAVQALQHYRAYTGVAAAQAQARTWLVAQKRADHSWGSAGNTAQVLLALLPAQPHTDTYSSTIAQLASAQQANGSWLQDAYTSALVLRALWVNGLPVVNPDMASLSGLLVAEDTGLALPGVTVHLLTNAQTAVTDSQGRFVFSQINAGSDTLKVQVAGYLGYIAQLQLPKGAAVDLGTLQLQPLTAGNASTATVTGLARFTDDGVNHQAASNATVSIGALTTQTDANGEYTISGLAPGALHLTASHTSAAYRPVQVDFIAQAADLIRFDPVFVRGGTQNTLYVAVKDQHTGSPIPTATVNLNGIVQAVNASGEAHFATGVDAGGNTVTVSATGYDTRIITMDVQGQQNIVLPVSLVQSVTAPGQTTLSGTVTDAVTHFAVQGAAVRLEASGHAATTNAQGQYTIAGTPDFAGEQQITIEHAGYQSHVQSITITAGRSHAFDVPLQPAIAPGQTTSLQIVVTDSATAQPIAGAAITLSGSNPHVAQTDASGVAQISGVNPGRTQIRVAAAGYDDVVFFIEPQPGMNHQVPVALHAQVVGTDRVYGRVIDAVSHQPIAGAKVILAGQGMRQTTADADGQYEFAGITLGRWNLSATASGYMGNSKGYDLTASSEVNIALRMGGSMPTNASTLRTIAVGHQTNQITNGAVGYLFVFGPQGTTGSVVSNDGAVATEFVIDPSGVAEIMVPNTQFLEPYGELQDKAMLVYASNPVSAFFLNREEYTTDMTYLLDVSALGSKYRILTWNAPLFGSTMSFTALENGTTVRVTPPTDVQLHPSQAAGIPFDVQLNKGQSYVYDVDIFLLNFLDITGTTLDSNKPIAVFAGSQCANVPAYSGYCDHLFTQLPPVEHWASAYVVPETANTGTAGNLVRVLSDRDANAIVINGVQVGVLNAGEFYEEEVAQDLVIESTYPVLVGQFLQGSIITTGGALGDPAFTYIPGIGQTLSSYVFTAPSNLVAYQQNYVNVAIPSTALASLRLNGVAVDTQSFRPMHGGQYSAGNVPVPPGPGEISASVPFLATLSGFNQDDSYHTLIGANYSAGASTLDPVVAEILVATDQASYPANTPAFMQASVQNLGMSPARLSATLQINDANGSVVQQFAPSDLGLIQPGQLVQLQNNWNTGNYPAGTYTLIGHLRDADANVVDMASTLFAIAAGASLAAPSAAISAATDKSIYLPDDRVHISSLVRNLTPNAHIDDARVQLAVTGPLGNTVFSESFGLGQLTAGGLRSLQNPQLLRNAPEGQYTVTATLYGSGNNIKNASQTTSKAYVVDAPLAFATAHYQVVLAADPDPGPGTSPGANADYAVSKTALTPSVAVGAVATWQIVVTNQGSQDGLGVRVQDSLPANLANASWTCTASGQAACGSGSGSGSGSITLDAIVYAGASDRITITVTGTALQAGQLVNAVEIIPINGSVDANSANNRSSASITVTGVGGGGGGGGGRAAAPIPANQPWAIALLALLLAAAAGVQRAQQAKRNHKAG